MTFWRSEVAQPVLDEDVARAIAEQRATLSRDPHCAAAHFALGTLLHFSGDAAGAVRCFEQAIASDASYAAAHVSLGRIHALRGDSAAAWRHARAAERLGDRSLVEQLERYPNAVPR
jgi:tetratricopeptide (TPR) repeat protein